MSAVAAPAGTLTERSAVDLARAIRAGEVSSRDAVEAHIERLQAVQPRIKALAAERFDAARAEAEAADRRVAEANRAERLPPLLGVPCTVKESIALAGMPNCAGLLARRDHRATETAPAAARLVEAGAIPLGVTNTSEMTMWIESQNFVYGRTSNAYDPSRVAGGSSGGEGAAVGSGGSPIGLGSDIGGSIRIPAFFNGVFGHKATEGVVPNSGQFPAAEGEVSRMLSVGPLARRAEDLMPVLRLIAGPDGADPYCRDVDLGDPADVSLDGLDVVVSEQASRVPVSRELREVRERAAHALTAAGARVRRRRPARPADWRSIVWAGARCAAAGRTRCRPPSCWPPSRCSRDCRRVACGARSRPARRFRGKWKRSSATACCCTRRTRAWRRATGGPSAAAGW